MENQMALSKPSLSGFYWMAKRLLIAWDMCNFQMNNWMLPFRESGEKITVY
jgi:hypothetical protein